MSVVKYKHKVETRSDLLTLLTEACELEHGLACTYLYAAFSLKQNLSEEGMDWKQLHMVRRWAAQIYMVAAQEMFHLSQAWNLLTALGGMPYYMRPNFPQPSKYYPLGLPLVLEPFSKECIKRFTLYELPQHISEKEYLETEMGYLGAAPFEYKTVGQLYQMIKDGIKELSQKTNLFIGDMDLQMGQEQIDFPEIVKVVDTASAVKAIEIIMEQGEGTEADHDDCHYGIFKNILAEFEQEQETYSDRFQPVRPAIKNPVVYLKGDYQAGRGTQITDEFSLEVADLFDDIYNLMLRCLQFVFSAPGLEQVKRKKIARFSIGLMPMVIKPLGDILMQLPAGETSPRKTAGPAFSMSRHVALPSSFNIAIVIIKDRYNELIHRSEVLSKDKQCPETFLAVNQNFYRLKNYIDENN